VHLLHKALRCEEDHTYVDLLTAQDLEKLKSGATQSQQMNSSNASTSNQKRFLILTCLSAQSQQKVHYPLQLKIVEDPTPDQLRKTLERMKNQI